MKIVFVGLSGYDYPFVRIRCYHFARELEKLGISTRVISYRDHLSGGLSETDMFGCRERKRLAMNARCMKELLKEGRDCLYYIQKIHYNAATPYLLNRLLKIPYVLDYDDWDEGIEALFNRPWINGLFFGHSRYREIFLDVARNARKIVVSSHFLLDICKPLNDNVVLIPTGVDTERFTPMDPPPKELTRFIWTGVVWGNKMMDNILFMLRCYSHVHREIPATELIMVGGGQLWDEVRRVVQEQYPGQNIEVRDWIPPDEMPRFLAEADIGLLPLIQYDDPWVNSKSPTKFFEYMASGLATVSSKVGELTHVITDGVVGFLAVDQDEFTDRMIRLASNRSQRLEMGNRAAKTAKKCYSISKLGENLKEFLLNI